jgi:proline iminopeptidase
VFDKAEVRSSGLLPVDGVHEIYWEESGNSHGIPALYLHGGPGGSLNEGGYRTKLDPSRFRIIGLDQRGCGRSTPRVTAPGYDLSQNTTSILIDDIEKVREHLRVDRWLVNGVSWGSTLALAYAQTHPERVSGIVLMAVTTTDRFQVDWITEAVGAIYPEAWDRLVSHAEQASIGYRRGEDRLIEAYARLMSHADPAGHCCIKRSAYPTWSTCLLKSPSAGLQMPGLSRFSHVSKGRAPRFGGRLGRPSP